MKIAVLPVMLVLLCGCFGSHESTLPWQFLTRTTVDASSGVTPDVALPTTDHRLALRVTAARSGCFEVSSAISADGIELSRPFARIRCPDCQWRTSVFRDTGLLVLEGAAAQLSQIALSQVDCTSFAPVATGGSLAIETLISHAAITPGIQVRLITSQSVDGADLSARVADELSLAVQVVGHVSIPASDVVLASENDTATLASLLATVPAGREGVIDVVIGPCLTLDTAFGEQRLAGITPRIPGGAGLADAVFVARRSCGSRNDSDDDPAEIARLVAHELGHYLGLGHTTESDGTEDDLDDTDDENLMNRQPLLAASQGLSASQLARLQQHPYVKTLNNNAP